MDTAPNKVNHSSREIASMLKFFGVYPTPQRLAIANVLFVKHQHITADQLYDSLSQTDTRVSRATVYNTIGLFVKRGLLREIFIDSAQTYYDSNTSHHHHYFNVDTGELTDVIKPIAFHIDDMELPTGTSMDGVDIVLRVHNTTS